MTSINPQPARRRRGRNILIVAGAVVVGLVVGLIVAGVGRYKDTAGQAIPTSTPVSVPASSAASSSPAVTASVPNSVDGVSGTLADGCLGGSDPFTAILAAQKAATPDNNGAAAFARTVARWSATYPGDPNAASVLAKLQAPGTSFAAAALIQTRKAAAALQSQGYVTGTVLPNLGQYRVLSGVTGGPAGSADGAIVQIQVYRELTNTAGQTSQTELTTELVLSLTNQVWTVVGSAPNQQDTSAAVIPWQSFSGAC